jgi:hypothetical protein
VDVAATPSEETRGLYAGWVAAALVILGVLVVGAVFWFRYHP